VRAHARWTRMLNEYEGPPIEPAMEEELTQWIARRKSELSNPA